METLLRDLRYAARNLMRFPAFTIAAVLALGLGIGSVTAIFTVLNGIVLRPLPFHEPDRLVMLWETNLSKSLDHEPISPVNFVDYRNLTHVFAGATAWWRPDFTLTDEENEPIHVNAIETLSNFFDVLGVRPALGRTFSTNTLFAPGVGEILISHRLWQNRFHSNPNLVGSSVRLNGRAFTVVGVMGPDFDFPSDVDIWQLQNWDPAQHVRTAHFMESVARLAPGVLPEKAQSELTALCARLQKEFAPSNKEWSARAVPVLNEVVGYFRPALFVLMAAVSLLLLMACINVANLTLARAAVREREVAIRSAIGASRTRLIRQFMTESILLAVMSSILGVILAAAAVRSLSSLTPIPIPRLDQLRVDWPVLSFAVGLTGLTALLFGFAPSALMSRTDVNSTLKEGSRGSGGAMRAMMRRFLVISEVALAVMVLVGAGLLIRTVAELLREKPGFIADRVITASVQVPGARYGTFQEVERFYSQLLAELRRHSTVAYAGLTNVMPLENGWRVPFRMPGDSASPTDLQRMVQYQSASDGFFQTAGVPVVRGRDFDERDGADNPGVVIVNEAFARQYFPTEDPVGKMIISVPTGIGPLGLSLMKDRQHQIIGVVGNVKNQTLRGTVEPSIFQSARQFPFRTMHIMIRGKGDQSAVIAALRDSVKAIDPAIAVANIRPLERILARQFEQSQFLMFLMSVFAVLALALASLGIYGVVSYSVAQRRQELSIRMALGAEPASVLRIVIGDGLRMTLIGASAGLLSALLFGRYLMSVLYGVRFTDPWTFGGVLAVVVIVAFAACFIPARRAASIDPVIGLRAE